MISFGCTLGGRFRATRTRVHRSSILDCVFLRLQASAEGLLELIHLIGRALLSARACLLLPAPGPAAPVATRDRARGSPDRSPLPGISRNPADQRSARRAARGALRARSLRAAAVCGGGACACCWACWESWGIDSGVLDRPLVQVVSSCDWTCGVCPVAETRRPRWRTLWISEPAPSPRRCVCARVGS